MLQMFFNQAYRDIKMILPSTVGLYEFSTDEEYFGSLNPLAPSWFGWNTLFKVYDGMKLNREEHKFWHEVTGGLPYNHKSELPRDWMIIVGRGGGKTRAISRIQIYRSFTFDRPLHPGQKAENIIISPTLGAGMQGFEYIEAMLDEHPSLQTELVPEGRNLIIKNSQMARMSFSNKTMIKLSAVTRIAGRGRSIWTLILEEAAHFKTHGRFSDEQVYDSANPGRNRFGLHSMCFAITTPFTKEGLVWKTYNKYFGRKNPFWLVINGTAKQFNPVLDDDFLALEEAKAIESTDPQKYKREYLAQFVDAIQSAFAAEVIEDATAPGRKSLPYNPAFEYFGFVDPASLSQSETAKYNDEYAAGVAHVDRARKKIVIDKVIAYTAEMHGRRYTPDDATEGAIKLFKEYKVTDLDGDKFGSGYIRHKFVNAGFRFTEQKDATRKSDMYAAAIPCFSDGLIELLDDDVTNQQFKWLERKRGRDGKEGIYHADDKHDDRANVVCGLIYRGKERLKVAPFSLNDLAVGGKNDAATSEIFGNEPAMHGWEFEGMS